ncbi:MAG: nucleoside hydrolase [Lachnospiraceae bacterium]|uniref:nucleoside hydrolase n=1 Tax=Parablautia sp. Marseille-Q6255 TaxID=3039593 RepID=UPI0024BD3D2E|nr:nucleoside hydrolase [Parablautia sp. Marseille-Q6255]
MKFPVLTPEERKKRLSLPKGKLTCVIDSDTYNEVDDQFAISYALLSPERLDVKAVYAAPFSSEFFARLLNQDSVDIPMTGNLKEGLELSYQEIIRLMGLLDMDPAGKVFRGSQEYMSKPDCPVDSEAARDLVKRAHEAEDLLYVIAIGEITNVASAILMDPQIIKKIVVVWLAGQPLYWPHTIEFNLGQDLHASRTILDSGVPLVIVPCMSVASYLAVTGPELEANIKGSSRLGTYLCDTVTSQMSQEMAQNWLMLFHQTYCKGLDDYGDEGMPTTTSMLSPSRIIWDISTVAWLLNPTWCPSSLVPTPRLTDEHTYIEDISRHDMRIVRFIYRDAVLGDMFEKIRKAP